MFSFHGLGVEGITAWGAKVVRHGFGFSAFWFSGFGFVQSLGLGVSVGWRRQKILCKNISTLETPKPKGPKSPLARQTPKP